MVVSRTTESTAAGYRVARTPLLHVIATLLTAGHRRGGSAYIVMLGHDE